MLSSIYVDASAVGAVPDGSSWASAYQDLQVALGQAKSGDRILVADGTYKPTSGTDRTISFNLKNGVAIYGGYAGYGAADPDARNVTLYPTILSGDIGVAGDNSDNSYHVVYGSAVYSTSILDGFTITAGNANVTSNNGGGGMYNSNSSPTLVNCTFIGNWAVGYLYGSAAGGAGMYNSNSSPTLTNCTFSGNGATTSDAITFGGGMYNSSSWPTLTNCTFIGNWAKYGGAMYNTGSWPRLKNCTFSGNFASTNAGGMCNDSSSSTLNNCIFSGNSAGNAGGGVYNSNHSSSSLANCTFSGNSAASYGGGIYNGSLTSITLGNCILWDNAAFVSPQVYNNNGYVPVITYSDVQSGWAGTGNVSIDPLFVRNPSPGPDGRWGTADDDYGDLRLRPVSPLVDAGSNAAVPAGVTTDLAGAPRFQDVPTTPDTGTGSSPLVDMGAYELVPTLGADAGGPYFAIQGQSLTLSGRGTSDVPGPLQYAWEWSGDGKYDEATGPNPVFSSIGWPLFTPITVSLRMTDSASHSVTTTTTITVVRPVLYVDADATGDNSGSNWSDAFTSLTAALSQAVAGQEIHAADGTYTPTSGTDRTISFNLKQGVAIYGGYAGSGTADPDARDVSLYPSILSGDIGTAGDKSDNSYHVIFGRFTDATAVLDGFTITGGNANGTRAGQDSGAGMYNYASSPTLSNCIFSDNSGTYGGGMYNNAASSPTLSNCAFSGNSAGDSGNGGGMYNASSSPKLSNCTFSGNLAYAPVGIAIGTAGYGGGMYNVASSPMLSDCTFSGNSGSYGGAGMCNKQSSSPTLSRCAFSSNSGGGIHNESSSPTLSDCTFSGNSGRGMYNESSSPTLSRCTFSDNHSFNYGGGMCNYSYSSPTLSDCTFSRNSAAYDGGGMYNASSSPTLSRCTFSGNSASGYGGGIFSPGSSSALHNCSFSGNSAAYGGGMYNSSSPAVDNCIFSGNSADFGGGVYNENSSPTLSNCTFSGNSASAGGGMYNSSSSPTLNNCTFGGNSARYNGGGILDAAARLTLNNCIVWGNTAASKAQIYQYGVSTNTVTVSYSDIQDGWAGTGNIDADPHFVRNPSAGPDGKWGTADDDYGDLRLQATSPAIDAGSNAVVPSGITIDLAGNSRFQDVPTVPDTGSGTAPLVDMGAYENQGGRDNLILADGAVVTLTADQHLASLSISGNAKLNLQDHELLMDSADLMQVRSWIQSGALFSDATIPGKSMALGYAPNGNGVLVKYTYRGDADLDGDVDGDDVAKWAVNFTGALTNPTNPKLWAQGDWDYDGDVDGDDVAKWAVNFTGALTSGGLSEDEPQPAVLSESPTAVLEPLAEVVSNPTGEPEPQTVPVSETYAPFPTPAEVEIGIVPPSESQMASVTQPMADATPTPVSASVATSRHHGRHHQPAMRSRRTDAARLTKTPSFQFRQGLAIRVNGLQGDWMAPSGIRVNPLLKTDASSARDSFWPTADGKLSFVSSH